MRNTLRRITNKESESKRKSVLFFFFLLFNIVKSNSIELTSISAVVTNHYSKLNRIAQAQRNQRYFTRKLTKYYFRLWIWIDHDSVVVFLFCCCFGAVRFRLIKKKIICSIATKSGHTFVCANHFEFNSVQ